MSADELHRWGVRRDYSGKWLWYCSRHPVATTEHESYEPAEAALRAHIQDCIHAPHYAVNCYSCGAPLVGKVRLTVADGDKQWTACGQCASLQQFYEGRQ